MAFELIVDTFDSDGIVVRHTFYGDTEADAEARKADHVAACPSLRRAEQEGRAFEFVEEIGDDEVPAEDDYEDEDEPDSGEEDE
jgi:hypothetical protein